MACRAASLRAASQPSLDAFLDCLQSPNRMAAFRAPPVGWRSDGPSRSRASPSIQRSKETRQLSAPKSMATKTRVCHPVQRRRPDSSEERFGQTAVHGNQVARGAARLRAGQKQQSLGAILGIDRLVRQRALGVKFRQQPRSSSSVIVRSKADYISSATLSRGRAETSSNLSRRSPD